jgi:cytochrome c551
MPSRLVGLVGPALIVTAGIVAAAAVGCSSSRAGTATEASSTTAAATSAETRRPGESEGAFVFRTKCSACHGTQGEGNLGPPLVNIADEMTEAHQITLVRTGRGRMPPFAPALTNADIAAVVTYTRTELDHPPG